MLIVEGLIGYKGDHQKMDVLYGRRLMTVFQL